MVVGIISEFLAPCGALVVGLLVGWSWKPQWAAELVGRGRGRPKVVRFPSFEMVDGFLLWFPILESFKQQMPSFVPSLVSELISDEPDRKPATSDPKPKVTNGELAVTEEDLDHLHWLVEEADGGPGWLPVFERSLPTFSYQSWRRDQTGPPMYRSRTVFEDATPEMVRDFFWDDEFRFKSKWDNLLLYHKIVEECPNTGTIVVHWVKKFPFFCSPREYTIGRRIWKSDGSYYCVTKGVPYPSIPRRNKPRRVDMYYSSWHIQAVESKKGNGDLTACEVILFHQEDMGISAEIVKIGVKQGTWFAVKRIEPGLRAYQLERNLLVPLSRYASAAQKNTNISSDYLRNIKSSSSNDSSPISEDVHDVKPMGKSLPKFLMLGGATVLACTIDCGFLTKAMIVGAARKFAMSK